MFAFRLTEAERDAIHRAAGRGKASAFVKGLALAVAHGEATTFDEAVKAAEIGDK